MPSAHILIAEDYDDNRELLRVTLEAAGYSVRETRAGSFDLALIDLSMPVLDGWDALRELRADERTRTLTCVAITAHAAVPDGRAALAAGFDAYISKPFHTAELLQLIARLLAGRRAVQT